MPKVSYICYYTIPKIKRELKLGDFDGNFRLDYTIPKIKRELKLALTATV